MVAALGFLLAYKELNILFSSEQPKRCSQSGVGLRQGDEVRFEQGDVSSDGQYIGPCVDQSFEFEREWEKLWVDYKTKFGKTYDTEQEDKLRKSYFLTNHYTILHEGKAKSYSMKVNQMSDRDMGRYIGGLMDLPTDDLSREEADFHGVPYTSRATPHSDHDIPIKKPGTRNMLHHFMPENFNWTDGHPHEYVSFVQEQGQCGACWTFAGTAAIESAIAISNEEQVMGLSNQQVLDCSFNRNPCVGGKLPEVFRYAGDKGLCKRQFYEYRKKHVACEVEHGSMCLTDPNFRGLDRGKVVGFIRVVDSDLALQHAAIQQPISVGIFASPHFHHLADGVYSEPHCASQVNHAVLIVGFGTLSGTKYWLIKNSWGTDWGVGGYGKVERVKTPVSHAIAGKSVGDQLGPCQILKLGSYPLLKNGNQRLKNKVADRINEKLQAYKDNLRRNNLGRNLEMVEQNTVDNDPDISSSSAEEIEEEIEEIEQFLKSEKEKGIELDKEFDVDDQESRRLLQSQNNKKRKIDEM